MSKQPSNPIYTYANVTIPNGGYTSNVALTGKTGITYTTAASAWSSGFNTPKVKITDSDIELDGLSMRKALLDLQSRLAIMIPNPALEKEFKELKACGDRYRELEQQFTEQLKMWNTLKSTDNK
jgi:hypothetical protein